MGKPPIMTPQQAKKTLSAKKLKKQVMKNTLKTPYCKYKPLITSEESLQITTLLSDLPRLIPPKVNLPWKTIKTLPKEARKIFKQQHQEVKIEKNKSIKNSLIIGINKVTEKLETNNESKVKVGVVLLADDINPFIMVEHVIDLCVLKNVPVLIVQGLRKCLNDSLGIASACLGVSYCRSREIVIFEQLHKVIATCWKNYLPPEDHAFLHSRNLSLDSGHNESVEMDSVIEIEDSFAEVEQRGVKNYHLTRFDNKSRVFVPVYKARKHNFHMDFIRFTPQVSSKTAIGSQVLKIMGNKNRKGKKKLTKKQKKLLKK